MSFLKTFFVTFLAIISAFFFLIFFSILIVAGIASSMSDSSKTAIEPNTVLHLNLDYPINEQTNSDPFQNINFSNFEPNESLGLNDILKSIQKAKSDDKIKGIYLDVAIMPNGAATTEAIRKQLIDFKTSGKFIVAYAEVMTQKAFYLNSVADKLFLNPYGVVEFSGFNSEIPFLKNMLERLEIDIQVFYAGKFKSATEPLRYEKMSDANREQITSYLNSMYKNMLTNIAASRNIATPLLDSIANNLLIRSANDALQFKFVDELTYYDGVLEDLKERTGKKEEEKIASISLFKYAKNNDDEKYHADKIAVVYAEGDIVDGKGEADNIGSARFAKIIRTIRQDKNVKGLVLRVNSPGGSALASEIILREIELARKTIPVIASMGNVAASGGYYISCYADSIFAEPNTITGSIGVFGILPNMQNFFKNKLGITFDNVKTGKFSDLGSISKPLNDSEKFIIQQGVDTIYYKFKNRVAIGRNMNIDAVDEIAQGRVWTGIQAQEIGLVDALGGLNDAVLAVASKAGLGEYSVVNYPEETDPFEKILKSLQGGTETYFLQSQLGEFYPYWKKMEQVKSWKGIQARIPFEINY